MSMEQIIATVRDFSGALVVVPEPGGDFAIMKEIKRMFDPENLLNRGRLYGHL